MHARRLVIALGIGLCLPLMSCQSGPRQEAASKPAPPREPARDVDAPVEGTTPSATELERREGPLFRGRAEPRP